MKKLIFSVASGLILSLTIQAQSTQTIQLEEVLQKVQENNSRIKIAEQNVLAAQADVTQSSAVFLPTVTASHTGITTTNPLMAFGSKLNQGILTPQDFNPDLLNSPDQTQNFATQVEVLQPLINIDGIYERKSAQEKAKATALQSERTKEYMTLEATNAYMQLQLAYKNLEVLYAAQKTIKEYQKVALLNFEQGYIQKADVLSVEIRVTEVNNQIQQAQNKIEQASNYLLLLINEESETTLKPTENLDVAVLETVADSIYNERSDIAAMKAVTDAYQLQYKSKKSSFLPRLNAFGSYELHDANVFQGGNSGYTFGAQLSWTLFEGNKRFGSLKKSQSQFEKAKIEYQQYIDQEKVTLKNAQLNLTDLKNQLTLSKLAIEQAEEVLRIRQNRFKEGLEKTSDLLQAETLFAQKELAYNTAIYQHNYALAYLQFLQN